MKTLHFITWLLIIIGAFNWLLVGVFGWDVGMLFGGQMAIVSRIIYILVGVSAIYEIFTHKSTCKMCSMPSAPAGGMMK